MVLQWFYICVKCLPDYCWPMFLHIADIMVPVQEKVWLSLSDRLLVYYRSHFLFYVLFFFLPFLCSVCLIMVLYDYWQHLFSVIFFGAVCYVWVVQCSLDLLRTIKTKQNLYLEKLDPFLISSHHPQLLSATLAVKCKFLLYLSRYQPGSTPLPGEQSHRCRLWSRVCPQHQSRLLTSALWVCQRTGPSICPSIRLISYVLLSSNSY